MATEVFLKKEFNKKFRDSNLISDFHSHLIFEKDSEIQTIIHSLKYKGQFLVGKMLGQLIAEEAKEKIMAWQCDAIIPIPLHPLKKAVRGYNQAYFISKGISRILQIPVIPNSIKRIKMTQTQTKLNLVQRKNNMSDAFKLQGKNHIQNKRIMLVDDVITTGATIKECAKILLENKAVEVFALSVAIADPDGNSTSAQEQ